MRESFEKNFTHDEQEEAKNEAGVTTHKEVLKRAKKHAWQTKDTTLKDLVSTEQEKTKEKPSSILEKIKEVLPQKTHPAYKREKLDIKKYKQYREALEEAGVITRQESEEKILEYISEAKDEKMLKNLIGIIQKEARNLKGNYEYDDAIKKYEKIYDILGTNEAFNINTVEIDKEVAESIRLAELSEGLRNATLCLKKGGLISWHSEEEHREAYREAFREMMLADSREKRIEISKKIFKWRNKNEEDKTVASFFVKNTGDRWKNKTEYSPLVAFNGDTFVVVKDTHYKPFGTSIYTDHDNARITKLDKGSVEFKFDYTQYPSVSSDEIKKGTNVKKYDFVKHESLLKYRYHEYAEKVAQKGEREEAIKFYKLAGDKRKAGVLQKKRDDDLEDRQKNAFRLMELQSRRSLNRRSGVRRDTDNPADYY